MRKGFDLVAFVARHGVVLAAGKGPVPTIAEAVAGGPIRGSWWSHEKGHEIFNALGQVSDSPDVLCFKLVLGKITFVHRRLWPALLRAAELIGPDKLSAIRQEHTPSGAHRNIITRFPEWVPAEVAAAARALSLEAAKSQLGLAAWLEVPSRPQRAGGRRPMRKPKPGK